MVMQNKSSRELPLHRRIQVEYLSKFSKFVCAAWPVAKVREHFLCLWTIMDNYCLIFWPSVILTQWSSALWLSNTGTMCSLWRCLTELTNILTFFLPEDLQFAWAKWPSSSKQMLRNTYKGCIHSSSYATHVLPNPKSQETYVVSSSVTATKSKAARTTKTL